MQVGDAYLIVYSITDRASFEKASELRIQLRRARQTEDIPIILVGNKSDLVRCREVSVSGEVLGTTLAPHTLACRQVPFPSPCKAATRGSVGCSVEFHVSLSWSSGRVPGSPHCPSGVLPELFQGREHLEEFTGSLNLCPMSFCSPSRFQVQGRKRGLLMQGWGFMAWEANETALSSDCLRSI